MNIGSSAKASLGKGFIGSFIKASLIRLSCVFFLGMPFIFIQTNVQAKPSPAQRALINAMKINGIRMRVAAENMANSSTVDYIPKSVETQTRYDPKTRTTTIRVKRIKRDKNRMVRKYDPTHPQADAKGMVNMPKLDPLLTMMNMHQARLDSERAMKSYKSATEMRHRTIRMMNR